MTTPIHQFALINAFTAAMYLCNMSYSTTMSREKEFTLIQEPFNKLAFLIV